MVIREDAFLDDLRAVLAQEAVKTPRPRDAAEGADLSPAEKVELMALAFHVHDVRQPVRAFDDLSFLVVLTDLGDQLGIVCSVGFCDEHMARAVQVARRFAQRSTRQQVAVAKGRLPIDQHDLNAVLEVEILQPVVEDERIRLIMIERVAPAAHAVLIGQHHHSG